MAQDLCAGWAKALRGDKSPANKRRYIPTTRDGFPRMPCSPRSVRDALFFTGQDVTESLNARLATITLEAHADMQVELVSENVSGNMRSVIHTPNDSELSDRWSRRGTCRWMER